MVALDVLNKRLSLSSQFLIAAAFVLCISMSVLGSWVNAQITRSVLVTSGEGGVAFMRGFLEPLVQTIRPDGTLPDETHQALDRLLVGTSIGRAIVSVKIWRTDGTVVYSSMSKDTIGKQFVSTDVEKAFAGGLVAEFEDMISQESAYEQSLELSLIEVYAPLYREGTREVLAVGEIYEDAEVLDGQLNDSRRRTWFVVCITTLLMLTVLYFIVRRGNATINAQEAELNRRVSDAQTMALQNEELRQVAELTRLDASAANEELIGRIGSDIHDGPIQLLSLVALRLEQIEDAVKGTDRAAAETMTAISGLTANVIHELRTLSTGLVLPEIGELSVEDAIRLAVDRHESMTGTKVELTIDELPDGIPEALKICLYRIVQESLTNAFRHAGGIGQRVVIHYCDGAIELAVHDAGTASQDSQDLRKHGAKLGLKGIQNRVTAFGGRFGFSSDPQTGTVLSVTIPFTARHAGS